MGRLYPTIQLSLSSGCEPFVRILVRSSTGNTYALVDNIFCIWTFGGI